MVLTILGRTPRVFDGPQLPADPAMLLELRLGTVGPRNHFVELQTVEEVLRSAAAVGREAA